MSLCIRALLLALLAGPAFAQESLRPDATIADFNADLPAGIESVGLRLAREVDADPADGVLRATPVDAPAGVVPAVFLPLAGRVDPATAGSFSFGVSVRSTQERVRLRVGATDASGRLILQRTVVVDANGASQPVSLALPDFRWGDSAGGWREARALRLAIETPFQSIDFDDLRLSPPASPLPAHERLARFAFPGKNVRMARSDTLFLATDVADGLTDADVMKIFDHMKRAEAFVSRTFGDAVRPVDDPSPISLFIFKDARDCTDFWRRRGAAWNVAIVPSAWGAYTVQDLATAVFDPAAGADRPTFVHEAVHAVIARNVRIMPGAGTHGWIQEGLANYVQLSLYPASFSADAFPPAFAAGVKEGPDAVFLPLERLMTGPVSGTHYAQIASLSVFIAETHPAWWPAIGKGLAAGKPMADVLKACGSDFATLQAEWLAWGRARFAAKRDDGHFAIPAEWTR